MKFHKAEPRKGWGDAAPLPMEFANMPLEITASAMEGTEICCHCLTVFCKDIYLINFYPLALLIYSYYISCCVLYLTQNHKILSCFRKIELLHLCIAVKPLKDGYP